MHFAVLFPLLYATYSTSRVLSYSYQLSWSQSVLGNFYQTAPSYVISYTKREHKQMMSTTGPSKEKQSRSTYEVTLLSERFQIEDRRSDIRVGQWGCRESALILFSYSSASSRFSCRAMWMLRVCFDPFHIRVS